MTSAHIELQEPPPVAVSLRIAVVSFVVVLLMTLVTSVFYLAGRIAKPVEAAGLPAPKESRRSPVPVQPHAVAPLATVPPAIPASIAAAAASGDAPAAGMYYQVAAGNREGAEYTVKQLRKTGVSSKIVASPSPSIFRVIVGPLDSKDEMQQARTLLEAKGYRPFQRRL